MASSTFNVGAGVKLIRHIQIGVNYNFALSHTATIETTNEEVIKLSLIHIWVALILTVPRVVSLTLCVIMKRKL